MPLTLRPPRPCFVARALPDQVGVIPRLDRRMTGEKVNLIGQCSKVTGSGMCALHRTTAREPAPPMAALTRRVA